MTGLFKYALHFPHLICSTPKAKANPISTCWEQQLNIKRVFCAGPRAPKSILSKLLVPTRQLLLKNNPSLPCQNIIHSPEDTHDARGAGRRVASNQRTWGKMEEVETLALFFTIPQWRPFLIELAAKCLLGPPEHIVSRRLNWFEEEWLRTWKTDVSGEKLKSREQVKWLCQAMIHIALKTNCKTPNISKAKWTFAAEMSEHYPYGNIREERWIVKNRGNELS